MHLVGLYYKNITRCTVIRMSNSYTYIYIYIYIYIYYIRAGLSGIEFRWGRDFPSVQTGPVAHPTSCKMGTESFPGVEAAGAWG